MYCLHETKKKSVTVVSKIKNLKVEYWIDWFILLQRRMRAVLCFWLDGCLDAFIETMGDNGGL